MIGCDCGVCRSDDPRDSRLRPSIYLQLDDDTRVLVDTTPDLRAQALRHDIRRVDAVLFTHAHVDHLMGLDEVRRFNVLSGGPLPIFADAPTLDSIRRSFSYIFRDGAPRGGGVPDLRPWTLGGGPFSLGRHEIVPVPVRHGPWWIFGFRVGSFAYLTDCNEIPPASRGLLRGVQTLVLDALRHRPHPTHFTLSQAVAAAREIGPARTFFTHIAHELAHEATNATLPPGMALAHDGLVLDLP